MSNQWRKSPAYAGIGVKPNSPKKVGDTTWLPGGLHRFLGFPLHGRDRTAYINGSKDVGTLPCKRIIVLICRCCSKFVCLVLGVRGGEVKTFDTEHCTDAAVIFMGCVLAAIILSASASW